MHSERRCEGHRYMRSGGGSGEKMGAPARNEGGGVPGRVCPRDESGIEGAVQRLHAAAVTRDGTGADVQAGLGVSVLAACETVF